MGEQILYVTFAFLVGLPFDFCELFEWSRELLVGACLLALQAVFLLQIEHLLFGDRQLGREGRKEPVFTPLGPHEVDLLKIFLVVEAPPPALLNHTAHKQEVITTTHVEAVVVIDGAALNVEIVAPVDSSVKHAEDLLLSVSQELSRPKERPIKDLVLRELNS